MRIKGKTRDGFKLNDVVRLLESFGAEVRPGTRHKFIATCQGHPFNCAIGPSTDVKKHVLPWMHQAIPQYSNSQIYKSLGRDYN
ncbi:MAG: hypothetical protein ISS48_03535 [Candidatus Aenigmarchaeota archaeon]|nr:hypothetical protein [Candidatus Aenigmarchaeota archaeon]